MTSPAVPRVVPSSSSHDLGHAQTGAVARPHDVGFEAHRAGGAGATGWIPPQDEVVVAGAERPRLARRAAGQALEPADLDRAEDRFEHPAHPFLHDLR